jgi:tetratricopeptide (TPR) repeat protein
MVKHLLVLIVPALAVLVYLNSLDGEFVWDDQKLILEDYAVQTGTNLDQVFTNDFFFRHENDLSYGYYRPMTTLSYVADYAIWGPRPFGFHVTNIALHAVCSILVVLLLMGLGTGRTAALLAGALFAVHPIHTENVAWIAGRTDVIAFLFGAGSLYLYVLTRTEGRGPRARIALLVGSLVSFALALLSKEMAILVPLWIVLCHLALWSTGWRAAVKALVPYAVVTAAYVAFRFTVVDVGVPGQLPGVGVATTAMSAPITILRYLVWMIVPTDQSAYVQNPYVTGLTDPRFFLGAASLALIAVVAWRWLRATPSKQAAFFAAALAVSFLPILNFVRVAAPEDMGAVMAERFAYFPSFPFFALIGLCAAAIERRFAERPWVMTGLLAAAIVAVGAEGFLTVKRNPVWHDEPRLFEDALRAAPDAVLLLGNLANHHVRDGDLPAADRTLDRIQDVAKDSYFYWSAKALLYVARGDLAAALPLQREIARHSSSKNAIALNNLAFLYRMNGQPGEAERILTQVIDEDHGYSDVWFNLAEIRRAENRYDDARKLYGLALADQPDSLSFGTALASMELGLGRFREAEAAIEALLQHHPEDPGLLNNLGIAAQRSGDEEAALRAFSRAVAADPGYVKARLNYGRLLLSRGERGAAAEHLEAVSREAPDSPLGEEAERLLQSSGGGAP